MKRGISGMKERALFIGCILTLALLGASFRWPVDQGKITSVFGEARADHFHDGVDMVCADLKVYPIAEGELAYLWDKALFPLDHYSGGGNYRVLRHEDGRYSLYLHLEDSGSYKDAYGERDVVGIIGNTGRSYGRHLHFTVMDPVSRSSVDPMSFMPGFEDTAPPRIAEVYLRLPEKYHVLGNNSNIRLTRHHPLLVSISDSMGGRESVGVHYLAVELNGKKVLEINFSEINFSKNGLTISGKKFQDLFDEKGYYRVGDPVYAQGSNTVKIVARDFRGNEAVKDITFNAKLEIQ